MANNASRDDGFIAGVSARPYVLGKLGGVAFLAVPEGLHLIVISSFKFRFTDTNVPMVSVKRNFQKAIPVYEQALQASGLRQKLQFQQEKASQRRRTRKRNITWFNPPYNDLVSTNVGKRLFYLEKHFPPRHRLHKIFNRNTIKLSNSCTTDMDGILSSHNKKILSEKVDKPDPPSCNCKHTVPYVWTEPREEYCLQSHRKL